MGQDASRRWWPDRHRPRGRRLARVSVLALVAGLAAGMLTGAASVLPAATHGSALHSYIVRARPGQLAQAAGLLRDRHIRMQRKIGIIDAMVAVLPAGVADALRAGQHGSLAQNQGDRARRPASRR